LRVLLQLQHEMACTGAPWGTAAALIGGNRLVAYDDVYRPGLQMKMAEAIREFWQHVENGTLPPIDGSAACTRALHSLYADETPGLRVVLSDELVALDARLQEIRERGKALNAERVAIENQIKAALEDAEFGELPGGVVYSWRVEPRKAYSVEASRPRVLRRIVAK